MTKLGQGDQATERTVAPANDAADQASLAERVARIQAEAAAAGFVSDGRDDKAFMDEMWSEG